jgi:FixJ family two-component response regulator
LLNALRQAIERSNDALRHVASSSLLQRRYESLSRREREVMDVVAGKMNKQIAGQLGISPITVKARRAKMKRKMSAKSLADLVRLGTVLGNAQHQGVLA